MTNDIIIGIDVGSEDHTGIAVGHIVEGRLLHMVDYKTIEERLAAYLPSPGGWKLATSLLAAGITPPGTRRSDWFVARSEPPESFTMKPEKVKRALRKRAKDKANRKKGRNHVT